MEVKFNIENRKELVKAIGEITGLKPQYMRAPSLAYVIGDFTVDRAGVVSGGDEAVRVLRDQLVKRGFEVVEERITEEVVDTAPAEVINGVFTVKLPEEYIQRDTVDNIRKFVHLGAEGCFFC